MKMNQELEAAFNRQLGVEFDSFYAYLQMAAWFDDASFPGFAHWMRQQANEEMSHAMKFYDFLLSRGNQVQLPPVSAPNRDFESPRAVFEAALGHEQHVSESIRKLYGLANSDTDYASFQLLQWFITEQVEEEETVSQILDQLRLIGNDGPSLLMLDRELGDRASISSGA